MPKEIFILELFPDLNHVDDFFHNRWRLSADTRDRDLRDILSAIEYLSNPELFLLGESYDFMIVALLHWLHNLQWGKSEEEDAFLKTREYIKESLEGILMYCKRKYPNRYNH